MKLHGQIYSNMVLTEIRFGLNTSVTEPSEIPSVCSSDPNRVESNRLRSGEILRGSRLRSRMKLD
jgi:hypothetical protein